MRIAIFVDSFPVWTETFIINQITGLIDRGLDVDIYATHRKQLEANHVLIDSYRLIERTRYLDFGELSILERFLIVWRLLRSNTRWLQAEAWKIVYKVVVKRPAIVGWTRLAMLAIALPEIGRPPYDVLHCQFGNLGPRVLSLQELGLVHGALVTSFRGHDATQQRFTSSGFYKKLFEKGDLFFPVSEKLAERLISLGCSSKKIRVLHSGIDCKKFVFAERSLDAGETVRIVSIARFVEMKGLAYAIDAIAKVKSEVDSIQYTVVGDGVLRPVLERQIAELGLTRTVRLVGWKSHEEVTAILAESHILLAPSVTAANGETEGIPNAVKEAMAMGMPVVATEHGGIAELVQSDLSGYLVPERNSAALAERLLHLINHPNGWSALGKAGRAFVEKEFDIDRLNDSLVGYYRE